MQCTVSGTQRNPGKVDRSSEVIMGCPSSSFLAPLACELYLHVGEQEFAFTLPINPPTYCRVRITSQRLALRQEDMMVWGWIGLGSSALRRESWVGHMMVGLSSLSFTSLQPSTIYHLLTISFLSLLFSKRGCHVMVWRRRPALIRQT